MAYDYNFKSYVLDIFDCIFDMPLFDLFRRVEQQLYRSYKDLSEYDTHTLIMVHNYILFTYGDDVYKCMQNISHSHYARVRRVRSRVENIVSTRKAKFLTLTFTNECLAKTDKLTRRRYVTRFLNTLNPVDFVANIDFGALYDREHYHSIIACDDFDLQSYSLGNCDCRRVGDTGDDELKLSRYLNKLTNHALKESTCGSRLIYKRTKN